MGTCADFYVGRGETADWIGSIAWDGYPEGIGHPLLEAETEREFRDMVDEFLKGRDDATHPEHGWPWPWDDSRTTDYAYAFDGGKVHASCFGYDWFDPMTEPNEDEWKIKTAVFPDMSDKKTVAEPGSKRSGIMIFTG